MVDGCAMGHECAGFRGKGKRMVDWLVSQWLKGKGKGQMVKRERGNS